MQIARKQWRACKKKSAANKATILRWKGRFFRKKIKMSLSESYQSNSQSRGVEADISEYACTDRKTGYTFDSDWNPI
jgi:hypothetical protein